MSTKHDTDDIKVSNYDDTAGIAGSYAGTATWADYSDVLECNPGMARQLYPDPPRPPGLWHRIGRMIKLWCGVVWCGVWLQVGIRYD